MQRGLIMNNPLFKQQNKEQEAKDRRHHNAILRRADKEIKSMLRDAKSVKVA